jgi:hypothetical protein
MKNNQTHSKLEIFKLKPFRYHFSLMRIEKKIDYSNTFSRAMGK